MRESTSGLKEGRAELLAHLVEAIDMPLTSYLADGVTPCDLRRLAGRASIVN
jgi:hypothetical protein